MPVYVMILRESPLKEPARYEAYQQKTLAMHGAFALKPLVVHGGPEALEGGNAPDSVVMLEFPSIEEAKAWYNSPEYQAALPDRLAAADYRSFIVEGFVPPQPAS